MNRQLTEHERNTLTNGLRVAAERFLEHVSQLGLITGGQQLQQQFQRQAEESIKLANELENVEYIEVGAE